MGGTVEGLERGVYRYHSTVHVLEQISSDLGREQYEEVLPYLQKSKNTKVVFLIEAHFSKVVAQKGPRAFRHALIGAGQIQARLALISESLGLAYLNCGGGYDREIEDLLGINGIDPCLVAMGIIG